MTEIPIGLANGRQLVFDLDTCRRGPAFFLLSVRKCGSTLFNGLGMALADANEVPFFDARRFFLENIPVTQFLGDSGLLAALFPGNAYGGFRNMPRAFAEAELFVAGPKILLVRDPRDALVSEYFSNAYSHPIPLPHREGSDVTRLMLSQRLQARCLSIDESVLRRASGMTETMMEYATLVGSPSVTVVKYEDYIFDKAGLMRLIAECFDWNCDDGLIQRTLQWADVRPASEDPRAFVRQVTPGDHRNKLAPETIRCLDDLLAPAMNLFDYVTE